MDSVLGAGLISLLKSQDRTQVEMMKLNSSNIILSITLQTTQKHN